ncbi:porin [Ramlibacter sp. USB13]|uniref:Porin n=1 Tax=Ramlibacter cellulosilyticus TaxID=2764187 RepID=A0A923MMF7_9BURK|nr:porin [Ramlibacter cellulosilyticus]MBC5781321.1 porin [Ramlibacter cellulosilyticus]
MHARIAAAACTAFLAAGASAQSSVTVFGAIDLAIAHYKGEGTGSKTHLVPGGNQNNRIGVRGREDLGGGLYAWFELEAGYSPDTGTGLNSNNNNQETGLVNTGGALTFNRRSLVAIGGGWGELRFGRDYVPSFWPLYIYDPFRTGVGFGGVTILGSTVTNLRASNSIGYFTPGCDPYLCRGLFAQVMIAFGENPSGTPQEDNGKVAGLRVGYATPTWEASIAQSRTRNDTVREFTQTSGGGAVEAGFARLMVLAGENRTGRPVAALNNGTRAPFWQLGALVYAGAGYVPIAYTRVSRNDPQDSHATKLAFGYVYNLSKRTALYTTYAHIENRNALALPVNVGADAGPAPLPGRSASGWDVGVRHTF